MGCMAIVWELRWGCDRQQVESRRLLVVFVWRAMGGLKTRRALSMGKDAMLLQCSHVVMAHECMHDVISRNRPRTPLHR